MPSHTTPPHRAEPTVAQLTDDEFAAFYTTVDRGFHEQTPPALLERKRAVTDLDRFFGYRVGDRWVTTMGSFARQLTVPGGARLSAAAVTNVTVHTAYRRRGLMRAMMERELGLCQQRGESAAVLYASESSIYGRFGYGNATPVVSLSGRKNELIFRPEIAAALTTAGGSVDEVDTDTYLDLAAPVHASLGAARAGSITRPDSWWRLRTLDPPELRHGATPLRCVVSYDADGHVDGHATYRVKGTWQEESHQADAVIEEIGALSAVAAARLWRYLLNLDLVQTFSVPRAPMDYRLQHLVTDPRAIHTRRTDGIYVRLIEVAAALSARQYAAPADLTLDVCDATIPDNSGRYRLTTDGGAGAAERTDRDPDLTLDIRELSAAYLGGVSLGALHAAGLVEEHRPGALAAVATAFGWPDAPFCSDFF